MVKPNAFPSTLCALALAASAIMSGCATTDAATNNNGNQSSSLPVAPSSPATSIWQITKNNQTVFIGGTVHVLPASEYPLPAAFDTVFAQSDELVFETDMAFIESAGFQQMMMQSMLYQDDTTFKDVLSPETVDLVAQHLAQRDVPIENVLPMKPVMLGLTVTFMELQLLGLTEPGVDKMYFDRGNTEGKAISWLETPEEQLGFMQAMASGNEDEFVQYSVKETANAKTLLDGMLQAWRVGNMQKMAEVGIADMATTYPDIYNTLLVERNSRWVPQIEAMFADEDTEFVLVGTLHMAGEHSILAMLADTGYIIKQL